MYIIYPEFTDIYYNNCTNYNSILGNYILFDTNYKYKYGCIYNTTRL